jgi:Flp pilus assembly protein TadG
MFAIMIVVLVGMVGLVVDAGMLYVTKSRLQNSVDAAALAGAQGLPLNSPITIACASIADNLVPDMTGANCGSKADVVTSGTGPDTITVTTRRSTPPLFMGLLGASASNVQAKATVKIASVGGRTCFFPLFIDSAVFKSDRPLYTPIAFSNHNTAVLEVGATGNSDVTVAMSDDCTDPAKYFEAAPGDTLNLKSGSPSQWRSGWDALLVKATASSSACKSPNLLDYILKDVNGNNFLDPALDLTNCPRLLMVPITQINSSGDKGKILGFTPFFFSNVCDSNTCTNPVTMSKHDAWGYYLNMEFATGGAVTDYNSFGTKIIVMTQ